MSDLQLIQTMPSHCCPYCGKPVGYLGRAIAWLMGTGFHGCDFSNVAPPTYEIVRVVDTADGLLIHPEDFRRLRLIPDHAYKGQYLPDGRYQIAMDGTPPPQVRGASDV